MNENANGKKSHFRIGELLVHEGIVKEKDVEKALEIQRKEIKEAQHPLGMLLVQNGLISKDQLQRLLNHPYMRKQIGKLAIEKGLINEKQLNECLEKKTGELVGQTLIRQGYATADDVRLLLNQQSAGIKLGELALKSNMVSEEDLNDILYRKKYQRTIGEILCDMNLISPLELMHVLQKHDKKQKLGDILIKMGVINKEQLKDALYEQRHRDEFLGNILIEKKFITLDELYTALSKQYNIEFRKLDQLNLSQNQIDRLSNIISQNYAEKNRVLPISYEANQLTLGLSGVENFQIMRELNVLYSHLRLDCVLITDEDFRDLFKTLYGKTLDGFDPVEETHQVEDIASIDFDLDEKSSAKEITSEIYGVSDMKTQEVVNYIIRYGILKNASDIHIEQDRMETRIRYRIDGVLQTLRQDWLNETLRNMTGAIISRIKVMADLDIAERRLPQDGAFRINYKDKSKNQDVSIDLRIAVCPAIVGENVTVRILDSRTAKVGLDKLGHSKHVITPLKRLLKSSAGMILVSGPTGSGKTSTLYGALQFIYNPGIKIVTAEDPIEYSIPGIMQAQILPKINLTFARLLRSFLRSDPDVILVGEMRDSETAGIGFDAVQTGHLLLSTIHTNDSIGAISRLHGLKVEPNQIAAGLMAVLAQRLVRKICPACSKKYTPDMEEWSLLFRNPPTGLTFYKAEGCEKCGFTGYIGRTIISEIFEMNEDISMAIIKETGEKEIKQMAIKDGMKTMVDDAILSLDQTTLAEIIRTAPHEMIKEFKLRDNSDL